jgi:hypothetical protein
MAPQVSKGRKKVEQLFSGEKKKVYFSG